MQDWKILITDGLNQTGLSILTQEAHVDKRDQVSSSELIEIITGFDALIVRGQTQVTSEVFAASQKLKVVGRAGVGVDNIDLAAANSHNVTVVNSPHATTQAVAEHTIGLMFSLARSIPYADASMKSGLWLKNRLYGVEIKGQVLGIIGMGNIGRLVAQLANSLGMTVLGHDSLISHQEIQDIGVESATLQDLLSRSDFISIHVPLGPKTRGMIDGQAIGYMKRGVRLISTARGGILNETALLGALESGQISAAALDVFNDEPPGLTALVSHPQVIATPHIAAQTIEAQSRAAVDIATEVLAALRGDPLRWKIV
jgi:D-3-phosphoglycerate dehydrogenase